MTMEGSAQADNGAVRQAPPLFQWSVFPVVLTIVIAGSYALMIRGVNPALVNCPDTGCTAGSIAGIASGDSIVCITARLAFTGSMPVAFTLWTSC